MRRIDTWIASYKPRHIVNVSGGKDSGATALVALENNQPFRLVMADTGNEHELTYQSAQRLADHVGVPLEMIKADFTRQIAGKRNYVRDKWPLKGVPQDIIDDALSVLYPTGNPYLDLCLWKGRFPSRKAQFCTEELKREPIDLCVIGPAANEPGITLHWMGVRADESARRRNLPPFERYDLSPQKIIIYRPILNWTVEKVFAIHKRHGFAPNPLYSMGMGRVGCMPCINCAKDELREIALRFPAEVARIREWERLVALASKQRMSTFFPAVQLLGEDESTEINRENFGIDAVVSWSKTTRGGTQFDLLAHAQDPQMCSSKYGLCE